MAAPHVCDVVIGDGPVVATALHDGHDLRTEVADATALADDARLREEDPHTGRIAAVAPTSVVVRLSRFEVDLNRPRASAVYVDPDDAWGLDVWKSPPVPHMTAASLAVYDVFYEELRSLLDAIVERHGCVVVLDVHSYNHRRSGRDEPCAPAEANPEVNVGTGWLDRARWAPLVSRFMGDLAASGLDVRENVRFRGGRLSRWVDETYAGRGCALALEFKKTFMDEWTGALDDLRIQRLRGALAATFPGLAESLTAPGR